jgi:hypothetical protein
MWRKLSPYTLVERDNPVFQQEQRYLRWLKTPESLRRYNLIVWIGIPALIVSWWFIERINLGFKYVQPDLESRLLNVVLLVSLGVMILSSFYIIITTLGRVHKQFHAGDWETLRMTHQPEEGILIAKNAIAQIQAWPFIAVEIGLRVAVFAVFTFNNFYHYYHISADKSGFVQTAFLNMFCWCSWAIILAVGLAFMLEPLLRTRVLIAWSTAIALQVRSASLSLLAGFGAGLLFHLTQIALIGGLEAVVNNWANNSDVGVEIVFVFIPLCLFAAASFYVFYIGIRRMSSNFIRRKAFAQD